MKTKLFLLFFITIVTIHSFGQKQGNVWMFGQGGALDFNGSTPTAFSGSQVFGTPTQSGDYTYSEGCASISDSSGNLLFYSNGGRAWNKLNQVMPNGDSLKGFYSSTTAAFIIPVPLSDSLYYLFTTDGIERYLQNGLRYSIIDMCLDHGNGDIISSQKNIPLLDSSGEKLCAIAHPNGTDVWLIAHKHFTNSFYTYLISSSGISAPIVSSVGTVHTGNMTCYNGCCTAIGQMKGSSNGNKIALVFSNVTPAIAEIFDFDSVTGVISNPISLQTNNDEYGVEFSPDNSKLYITNTSGVFQFDLNASTQTAINASKTQIVNFGCYPGPIQLGPDGKIYVARFSNFLSVISNPNNLGTSCNYLNNTINISPATFNTSLPSFISGFKYKGTKIGVCATVGIKNEFLSAKQIIFPNPFSSYTTIKINNNFQNITLTICNTLGQEMKVIKNISGHEYNLYRDNLQNGIYFIHLTQDNKTIAVDKLIVTD